MSNTPLSSLVSQRDDRIHQRRSTRWHITREKRGQQKHQRHNEEHQRIGNLHAIHHSSQHSAEHQRTHNSNRHSHRNRTHPLPQHHPCHRSCRCSQRHANSNFARALSHEVREHAINSNRCQQQCQRRECAHQLRRESSWSKRCRQNAAKCADPKYRQLRIYSLNFAAYRLAQSLRITRTPQHHRHHFASRLVDGKINVRHAIVVDSIVANVAHHSHNRRPRTFRLRAAQMDALTNRRISRPEFRRSAAIHNRYPVHAGLI